MLSQLQQLLSKHNSTNAAHFHTEESVPNHAPRDKRLMSFLTAKSVTASWCGLIITLFKSSSIILFFSMGQLLQSEEVDADHNHHF
jgi:hypothetical protein